MGNSMVHLNGNILCAIDTETTGLNPFTAEIWQIAVVPLDADYEPRKDIWPFYQEIKIQYPQHIEPNAIKMPKEEFWQKQQRALDPLYAADLLDEWFQRLKLPFRKKMVPLAQNWPFDHLMIVNWLGFETFNQLFHPWYRDTMCVAQFMNDSNDMRNEQVEFPQANHSFLCARTGVTNDKPHDALQDALASAKTYKRLVKRYFC